MNHKEAIKGNVRNLVKLVDSYISDLTGRVTSLKIKSMAKGSLTVIEYAKLAEIENRLKYVKHEKDKALYIDAESTENKELRKGLVTAEDGNIEELKELPLVSSTHEDQM